MSLTADSGGFWRSVRQLPGRTPLRVKLITAVLAFVAIALAVISIAGISVLKSDLLDQADSQLDGLVSQVKVVGVGHLPTRAGLETSVYVVQARNAAGGLVAQVPTLSQPGPAIPPNAAWMSANSGQPVTVAAKSGGDRWLVIADPETFTGDFGQEQFKGTLVVALDVTNVYDTVGRLIAIDIVVSALIVLGLAVVGIAVVRASLQPLIYIEQTAGAIAAGDLTQRVPDRDPRTEVGRLGRSLNAMLAQIEFAFRARADSEAAARRSEERIRQFVADASHELRTPLTAIRGFAEYYRQRGGLENGRAAESAPGNSAPGDASTGNAGMQDGSARELPAADPGATESPRGGNPLTRAELDRIMRRVEQESSRMGVLVEDMLLLARLDQQRPLENRPVDLLTLAADAVHDARVMAPQRSIDLTVGAGAALIVLGDEVRLRQVIGNLMSNALIHTPDGTPVEVRIRPGRLDEVRAGDGDMIMPSGDPGQGAAGNAPPAVIFEVADRGPGLTPDQAERAFERFYRADQARARQAGGTGLGLAIVAALVVAHGGRVSVEPTPGSGATFRIALPLAPEALGPGPDSPGPDKEYGLDGQPTAGREAGPDGQPMPAGQPAPGGESGPGPEPHAGPGPVAS